MDLSEPTSVWNTLSVYPTGLTNYKTKGKKLLSVAGKGSGLSFTVQIAEGASEIVLDEPHTFNVQGDEVRVFQFIPPQGISDKQLDITATSQSKVAAYLKVSQNCKEVDLQKDLESIDYKKESLRLSFATKGRITLSRVSIPPLTDSVSRWFIGIGLKNLSGAVKVSESKNVTLKLTRSFDYNYATPICVLVFVSFLVGTLVSIIAYFLFEDSLIKVEPGEGNQVNNNSGLRVLFHEIREVIRTHWFSSGPETYPYITVIVGFVLMVGAIQYVFSNWYTMIQEGDRDNCYYNDFCYRFLGHDIPFNLMISNLTYMVHGLILTVWVLMLESKVNLAVKATAIKERYCFSIGYAYSWAFVFQGLFSALYHLCPSRFTFQFDSAFMFIIAGLTVLTLYNGNEQNRFQNKINKKYPVRASNFFLFFIVPLFFFNLFFPLLNPNSGLNKVMQMVFIAFLIIWWFAMVYWAYLKLKIRQKIGGSGFKDKRNVFLFILGGLLGPCVIFMFYLFSDLNQVFLYSCIFCAFLAILAKCKPCEKLSKCKFGKPRIKEILRFLFMFLTVIIFAAALGVFRLLPTTDKNLSPENSRDQNQECVILEFFDWHDLWHFLSSFALLMGTFVVIFISPEPEQSAQAKKNKQPGSQGKKGAVRAEKQGNNNLEAQKKKRA